MNKTIYHYDPATGYFTGADMARESPMEPGVFLVPANATMDAPPPFAENQRPVFRNGGWIAEDIPLPPPVHEPTLDEITSAKWGSIKAERDRRKNLGFQCAGHWYHSDVESKTQHLGNKDTARDQIAAGGQPADSLRDPITNQPIVWKTMSGQFVPLTCALAIDIVAAGKSAEFATFAAAEMHRAQMLASPDPDAYDFSAGWPAIFEG